jgi:streptogramin lyase
MTSHRTGNLSFPARISSSFLKQSARFLCLAATCLSIDSAFSADKPGSIRMFKVGVGASVDPVNAGSTHELDVEGTLEVYFVQQHQERVGRIVNDQVSIFQMPEGSEPHGIATLRSFKWVLFEGTNQVARINSAGQVVQTIDLDPDLSFLPGATAGPHGLTASGSRLWYAGKEGSVFGWVDPKTGAQGAVAAAPVGRPPQSAKPIWVSPDGKGGVWGTQLTASKLCHISVYKNGETRMQEWTLGDNGITDYPIGIVDDLQGGAWFSVEGEPGDPKASGYFGHITKTGDIFTWSVPRAFARLGGLALDKKGNLWIEYTTSLQSKPVAAIAKVQVNKLNQLAGAAATQKRGGAGYKLNHLNPGSALTEIRVPQASGPNHFLHRIQVNRTGKKVWFTDITGDQVGVYYVP